MSDALQSVKDALGTFDKDNTEKAVNEALESGATARQIFDVLIEAMTAIGKRFEKMEVFLPEVMKATDAMKATFEVLVPLMVESDDLPEKVGTVIFGTVKGDIHNVGKDMVVSVMNTQGFDVIDLGVDVPASKFYEAAQQHNPDIVAVCAIMSSTIPIQKDVIDYFVAQGDRGNYKFLVGGGSTNPGWAEKIGADGWGKDAVEATEVALGLVGKQ